MIKNLRQYIYDPRVKNVNVDDNRLLEIHSEILREKALLRSAFETFYHDMAKLCDDLLIDEGLEVELGTGAGFFKSIRPNLITSDIRSAPNIDMTVDAQAMSFEDQSVRCIYAINVFHHLPNPNLFFDELIRVLDFGGGCILIEPHGGFSSALLHRYLHNDEHFNLDAPDWTSSEITGPLSGANQALSHIVFERDKEKFSRLYGSKLQIVHRGYELNAMRYLLSGGLNFRQLLPSFMNKPITSLEKSARLLAKYWSLHQVIVIKRKAC